jgi:hypothetical protein
MIETTFFQKRYGLHRRNKRRNVAIFGGAVRAIMFGNNIGLSPAGDLQFFVYRFFALQGEKTIHK